MQKFLCGARCLEFECGDMIIGQPYMKSPLFSFDRSIIISWWKDDTRFHMDNSVASAQSKSYMWSGAADV